MHTNKGCKILSAEGYKALLEKMKEYEENKQDYEERMKEYEEDKQDYEERIKELEDKVESSKSNSSNSSNPSNNSTVYSHLDSVDNTVTVIPND